MNIKTNIYGWFHVIYFILAILFLLCLYGIFKIQNIDGDTWREISTFIKKQNKPKVVEPNRGKIYCINRNGKEEIVAGSILIYKVYFDGNQLISIEKHLKKHNYPFNRKDSITKLARGLSNIFGDNTVENYENMIVKAYNNKKKVPLNSQFVDYVQYKELIKLPLLNGAKGKYVSCLDADALNKRILPFGNLARRTIGDVYADKSHKVSGRFGIEMQFDSILRGKQGVINPVRVSRKKIIYEEDKKAIDGADITLTLDMDMQDIVENSLLQQMKKLSVERGCAILMETKTGEIKAMVNLNYDGSGYTELENMSISDMNPPGSTFKLVSMLVALENMIITPDTIVNAYTTKYKTVTDHLPNPKWEAIHASDVFVYSSNVGTANIIGRAYEKKPMDFVREIHKTKINEPFDIMLPGAAKPKIDTINRTDLPSMSFGYQVVVPPIYMLRFYNAVANNGKMINPFIIKEINNNGDIQIFDKKVVNPSICSPKTLKYLQNMLLQAVEKKGATAYEYRSKVVSFAGKTGTAFFKVGDVKTDQVSFCGYFPADKPKYSCIVVMNRQGIWGAQSCEVFRDIAEKISAIDNQIEFAKIVKDSIANPMPLVKNGNKQTISYILDYVNIKSDLQKFDYLVMSRDSIRVYGKELKLIGNIIPNFVGMGAKDAVYLAEKAGLWVQIYGKGTVKSQSLNAGAKIIKGQTIILNLD
jgi:cell division protein FtsI (penicillin-binding protein 3)